MDRNSKFLSIMTEFQKLYYCFDDVLLQVTVYDYPFVIFKLFSKSKRKEKRTVKEF
jgi:hypothetical protein